MGDFKPLPDRGDLSDGNTLTEAFTQGVKDNFDALASTDPGSGASLVKFDTTTHSSSGDDAQEVLNAILSNLGGGSSGSTKLSLPAGENISKGDALVAYDDGGTAKFKPVGIEVGTSDSVAVTEIHNDNSGFFTSVGYGGGVYVFLYKDNSTNDDLYVKAGTRNVDGTFTLGSAVQLSSGDIYSMAVIYDEDNDIFIALYGDVTASDILGKPFSVSGTTVTAGTQFTVTASAGNVNYVSGYYDTNLNLGVVSWYDGSNNLKAATLTITDIDTISVGSIATASGWSDRIRDSIFDPASNAGVFVGSDKLVACSISGTTITFGTVVDYETSVPGGGAYFASDGTNVWLSWRDGTSSEMDLYDMTISGNTITLGTKTNLDSGSNSVPIGMIHDSLNSQLVILYKDPNVMKILRVALSGTTVGTETEVAIEGKDGSAGYQRALTWDNDHKVAVGFYSNSTDSVLDSFSYTRSTDIRDDAVAVADAAYTSGNTATGTPLGGVSSAFTGKTAGTLAYIQPDAAISSTETDYPIGKFVSATELVITKNP